MTLAPDEVKACCASAYSSEAARFLLGDTFHPGGAALTGRLVAALDVGPGDLVVDVASGSGTSAIQLARETGCEVIGVELSPLSVAAARSRVAQAGLAERVRFLEGDAERLPLEDASMDGVLCECALCTFPNKAAAAGEIARVLRPGSHVAISDMTARPADLPPALTGLDAWVACIADARPLADIARLLAEAGLVVEELQTHNDALALLLERVDARLRTAGLLTTPDPAAVRRGRTLVAEAQRAVSAGTLGYGIVIATRP